ncbi:MAG TPA: hypothetical protein VJJ52_01755 [Candidatus Nanoarchaeia archaeon]|nr:hypothetical protein [Candidatus Nanoarchaeia archaeon]
MIHKKRGYFFVLDAALGLTILAIGVFLIASLYINVPEPSQVGLLSDDLMSFMANTKIRNLNSPYAGLGGLLWKNGSITNADNSLLQQVGEFYYRGNYALAEKFVQNISVNVVPSQFKYEMWMDNMLIYPLSPDSAHLSSKSKTDLLLTSKQVAFGIINKTDGTLWGPYKVEVFTWQK